MLSFLVRFPSGDRSLIFGDSIPCLYHALSAITDPMQCTLWQIGDKDVITVQDAHELSEIADEARYETGADRFAFDGDRIVLLEFRSAMRLRQAVLRKSGYN